MTIKDLINELKGYNPDVKVFFKLMPQNDGLRDESDEHDKNLEWHGEICTSGLDNDEPSLDIGLVIE